MSSQVHTRARGGLLSALRPRQWLKNALVAAAPLAGGEIFQWAVAGRVLVLFVLLCAVSAAGYVLNDVRDIEYDRAHPDKRHRAIASGAISPTTALGFAALLVASALFCAQAMFGVAVTALLAAYIVTTASYSLWLKSVPGVEMVVLSAGFLLRAVIGGSGTGTVVSGWFLVVICASALLVVSGKRSSELSREVESPTSTHARSALNSYSPSYLRSVTVMSALVAVAGYATWVLLVGAHRNESLLVTCSLAPLALAYLRYARIIRHAGAEAPEVVLLRDRTMVVCGVTWAVLFAAAVVMSP